MSLVEKIVTSSLAPKSSLLSSVPLITGDWFVTVFSKSFRSTIIISTPSVVVLGLRLFSMSLLVIVGSTMLEIISMNGSLVFEDFSKSLDKDSVGKTESISFVSMLKSTGVINSSSFLNTYSFFFSFSSSEFGGGNSLGRTFIIL